jgi:hypothetical protein
MIETLLYSVLLFGAAGTNNLAQVTISDGGCSKAYVFFVENDQPLPADTSETVTRESKRSGTIECTTIKMTLHIKEYPNFIDLLRNEKPLGVGYVNGRAYVANRFMERIGDNDN